MNGNLEAMIMSRCTVRMNDQTEKVIDELIEHYSGSKSESINLLVQKYLDLKKHFEQVQEELDEERRLRKSLLRNLEHKMNVVYEIENTRLFYEDFPELRASDQLPSHVLTQVEDYLEMKRKEKVFQHFEKRVNDR